MFTCSFTGDPEPTVTWKKDDIKIIDEGRFLIIIEEGYSEMEIENLEYSDAGSYQIVLDNSAGSSWADAILDMNGKIICIS